MEISYSKQAEKWDDIEEEAPDEIDIQMFEKIKHDPECREFTREQDINWD